ncbi:MAG: gamma-glutamylcyclotransferase [Actinomycetota bacterium]|nr:gamma-glutamylcyclotransferase [Actinomycetota bacterium]
MKPLKPRPSGRDHGTIVAIDLIADPEGIVSWMWRSSMTDPTEPTTALFVYGTLMPGQLRWPVLEPYAVATQPAHTTGRLWDTGSGYPAACFDDENDHIPGVFVRIAPDRLADVILMLDGIEGEGVLFRRVEVVTSAGPAMSYEWLGSTDGLRSLPHGWPART